LQLRLLPPNQDVTRELYDAISACQDLNPDPNPEDEENGGFDETAAGATGWITSENMADFMDEEGNCKIPEGATVIGGAEEEEKEMNGHAEQEGGLGEGAGRRRGAEELADGEAEADGEETKWQRTG
jgi:chloride channel, nucleotide-sensitive, 1A